MGTETTDVEVEINELALSVLGWEVQDFRARVTTTTYNDDPDVFSKLAISGVFRFNNDDWTDCFRISRDYPTWPVMVLRSPALSRLPAVKELYVKTPTKGRPARVSLTDWHFMDNFHPFDPVDLRLQVTGYDGLSLDNHGETIPLDAKPFPIEIEDDSTSSGVSLTFDQVEAFTYTGYSDEMKCQIRLSGRLTFGSPEELLHDYRQYKPAGYVGTTATVMDEAPFEAPAPEIVLDILDDTGFLLDQTASTLGLMVPVDADGKVPSRTPRWIFHVDRELDDLSASVGRIIARVEDE